jgi:hypothetical protein
MPRKTFKPLESLPTRSGHLFSAVEESEPRTKQQRSGIANRQEILNVLIAQLLQERGLVAAPEQIITRLDLATRRMPDVLVDFQGLRLVIESEYASVVAADKTSKAALRRVEEGIAHVGIALIYPTPFPVAIRQSH